MNIKAADASGVFAQGGFDQNLPICFALFHNLCDVWPAVPAQGIQKQGGIFTSHQVKKGYGEVIWVFGSFA